MIPQYQNNSNGNRFKMFLTANFDNIPAPSERCGRRSTANFDNISAPLESMGEEGVG